MVSEHTHKPNSDQKQNSLEGMAHCHGQGLHHSSSHNNKFMIITVTIEYILTNEHSMRQKIKQVVGRIKSQMPIQFGFTHLDRKNKSQKNVWSTKIAREPSPIIFPIILQI